jgi:2-hydroxychromene-2-carboxylate isomerase
MGEVIFLADRCAALAAAPRPAGRLPERAFYVDLTSPFSYLDGDLIERALGDAQWHPVPPCAGVLECLPAAWRELAERRAERQRLPLTWPENDGHECTGLHRAAAHASAQGLGAPFTMAALRLAFSGGFDLAGPFLLEEAAAAAGLAVEACVAAAADPRWDGPLAAARDELTMAGLSAAPAIRIGGRWFSGERAVGDAAAVLFGMPAAARLGVLACS